MSLPSNTQGSVRRAELSQSETDSAHEDILPDGAEVARSVAAGKLSCPRPYRSPADSERPDEDAR